MELGYGSWAFRTLTTTGFGLPNRRRRVFIVASLHGDARDVLLAQGALHCLGGCARVFGGGRRCAECHVERLNNAARRDERDISYALDLGNAMCAVARAARPAPRFSVSFCFRPRINLFNLINFLPKPTPARPPARAGAGPAKICSRR
jgi:site-specific DNA-cytosine methylase